MTILSTANFYDPFPQFLDQNGSPISGGRLVFRDASTNALKEVYTDRALSVPAQNPQPLGADARPQDGSLYLAEGVYKITLQKPDGGGGWVDYITNPEVSGSISAGADVVSLQVLANIASLRSAVGGFSQYVLVMNYYTNDRGGGFFRWDASSILADDGGSVIQPASLPATGRWIRIFSGSGVLSDEFGAVPSQPAVEGNLLNASAYCSSNSVSLTIRGGTYSITGNLLLSGNYPLIIDGAKFTSATGSLVNLSTSGLTITQIQPMILSTCNLSITTTQDWVSPVYWGAVGDGVTDCYSAFVRMTGRHNAPALIDRDFNVTAVGAPSIQQITLAGVLFKGGRILLQYADAGKFAISGAVQLDDTSSGCLQGFAGLGVFALSVKRVSARVWFSYNSGSAKILLDTATFNQVIANYTGALVFDGVYDYLMSATTTGINNDCIISNGVLIYTNGARQFGYVQANPYQQVFALDSGGISITPQNRIVYGGWYGIRSGDETGDFDFCLASTSAKTIDFAGLSFNVSYSSNKSTTRAMQNGAITSIGASYLILSGGANYESMTFDGNITYRSIGKNKFTNCKFLSFGRGDFTGDPIRGVFVNCEFLSDLNFLASANLKMSDDHMRFVNCDFTGLISLYDNGSGTPFVQFVNCDFSHDDTATFAKCTFSYSNIQNCTFSDLTDCQLRRNSTLIGSYARRTNAGAISGVVVVLENTGGSLCDMGINIQGNHLGQVYIDTSGVTNAGSVVNGLNITNNFFDPIGITTTFNAIQIGFLTNIASAGHSCQITKNTYRANIGTPSSNYAEGNISISSTTINTSKVILPRVSTSSTQAEFDNFTIIKL